MDKLTELTRNNLWTAVDDYRRHSYETNVLDDISSDFINRLADDSIKSKRELRELFRKSHAWDENLQSIVINGTKTHNPDYILVQNLANQILAPVKWDANEKKRILIDNAICFFSRPNDKSDDYRDAIEQLAPNAYAPHKKRSRIFKALCDTLGVTDNSAGSQFQRLFAQFADELSTRKIDFKLFLSINPAHFLTMSNPKDDERGDTLVSCHSFNSTDCDYNCGCSGYARDNYSFIVFTASDPNIPETLNNRKTSRQLFMYKPHNGLLLQSRLYKTSGGTRGSQAESKLYRDLVQRELSELEDVPNLWLTEKYCGNKRDIYIHTGYGFGGYTDWVHSEFDAKISIREDHLHDYKVFNVGTYGLCISCGDEISSGLYCDSCDPDENEYCSECDEYYSETWEVINRHGERIQVCEHCLNNLYRFCELCEEYHPREQVIEAGDGSWVCSSCLENEYLLCDECHEYFPADEVVSAIDDNGDRVYVCRQCREDHYETCSECDEFVHVDLLKDGLCPDCHEHEEVST
ncbi:MAG: hypothetical protein IKN27_14530 [Selenomonadaceae bacterium]|nr:hypothetical protein [Selenomonadaceae bacterium]